MNAQPLISVIIPVYNNQQYIEECLNSLLQQSYRQLEIIVIDDGSSDRTGIILDEQYADNNRITVIHKKNGGVSAARNDGIRAAHGKYIAFLDSDDIYLPGAFEQMLSEMDSETDFLVCSHQKKWIRTNEEIQTPQALYRDDVYRDFEALNLKFNFIWANLYRTAIIREKQLFFNEAVNFAEDYEFNLNYIKNISGKIVLSDKVVYRYIISRSGAHAQVDLTAMNIQVVVDFFGGKEQMEQELYDFFVEKYLRQCIGRNIWWHAPKKAAALVREAFREALPYANKALLHRIFSDEEYRCIAADDYNGLIQLELRNRGRIKTIFKKVRYRISRAVAHALS